MALYIMFLSDEKTKKVAGHGRTTADWRTPLHTRTTLTHSIYIYIGIYKS